MQMVHQWGKYSLGGLEKEAVMAGKGNGNFIFLFWAFSHSYRYTNAGSGQSCGLS